MTTHARKNFHDELAAWLEGVRAEQNPDVVELDRLANLWLANGDAKAIVDKASPAAEGLHAKIDGILSDMGY